MNLPAARSRSTPTRGMFKLLARHAQVAQAAWGLRKELDGPLRHPHELEFLPARVALQDTPPHPAPRVAMGIVGLLFLLAVAWSIGAQVDIVATAPGRLTVAEHTKVIQPLEPSIVRAIHVSDGSHVQAGDLLVELDPTSAIADGETVTAERIAAETEVRRVNGLLELLERGAQDPRGVLTAIDAVARAEWADIRARQDQLTAEVAQRRAEIRTHDEAIAKFEATLPMARQREADLLALQAQGYVAGHASQDRTRERVELEGDLATQRARQAEAVAALAEREQARVSHLTETRRTLSQRLSQAREKITQLAPQSTKAERRQLLTKLIAPVSGKIQQLAVHTVGGVVTEAQALMVVVPDDAPLTAEVTLDNKDIGFVHTGQPVAIKLDTFNFTRYGTIPATVAHVSADALIDEKRGAIFAASLTLGTSQLQVDGRNVALAPGMNITAEIMTGKRQVIDYLLSPFREALSESLTER